MAGSATQEQRMLRLRLTGRGRLGEALAEADGKQVFVFGGIEGEEVVAEVLREYRSHIAARVVEVVESSPHRVAAPCPYVGDCNGCQWQHIAYERQLEMKRETVADALVRVGGLEGIEVRPTLPSPRQVGYRNHARFTVSREGGPSSSARAGRLGFVNRELRRHVEVDQCLIMEPQLNKIMAQLQGRVGETSQVSVRVGEQTGSYLVQPTLTNPDIAPESGQSHYEERLHDAVFRVASPSFFQVNTKQAERVADLVREALALTGSETVVDAFAGVGTFAVLLTPHARRIIAIEDSAPAVADAQRNAAGLANVEFRQGRTEDVLQQVVAELSEGIDAVVLDPPRAGCAPEALRALIAAAPRRIAYVSCDPETLARDLKVLTAGPFRIERVQPVDMFPQTYHTECLVTLVLDETKRGSLAGRQGLTLASASPRRREIMARLGIAHEVADAGVAEPSAPFSEPPTSARPEPVEGRLDAQNTDAVTLATERALDKARAVAAGRTSGTVVGADTVVELDGRVLGKPRDADEAGAMLRALRGREHRVSTALALVDAATGQDVQAHRVSRVVMRDYTDDEIAAYIATGDPFDKAGAYAVQHEGFAPAAEVRGCYLNVVGLPVCTLLELGEGFGLDITVAIGGAWPELARCPACAKQVTRRAQRG